MERVRGWIRSTRSDHLVAIVAVTLAAATAGAQDLHYAIPPGQEDLLADMLGRGVPLPGPCRWDGASVESVRIRARYVCDRSASREELILVHPTVAPPDAVRTARFALIDPRHALPAAVITEIASRVRAREARWMWSLPESASDPGRWPAGIRATLAAMLVAMVTSLALLWRNPPTHRRPGAQPPGEEGPLAALASIAAVAIVAVAALRFRYVNDDYVYLERAMYHPWQLDGSLRIVSTSALFFLGRWFGRPFFALANVGAVAAASLLLRSLFRRGGATPGEATLAGALLTMAPATIELLRMASGFQYLAGIALVLGSILLLDEAASEDSVRRRGALLALSLSLGVLLVFVKFALLGVLPVAGWLWGRRVVRQPRPPLDRNAFYALSGAAFATPLLVASIHGVGGADVAKLGAGGVARNLAALGAELAVPARGLLLAVALLLLHRIVADAIEARRACQVPFTGAMARTVVARTATTLRRAVLDPLGSVPLVVFVAVVAVVWSAPFMANARYFAAYYALPASVPVALLAARVLSRARRAGVGVGTWIVSAAVIALLIPRRDLRMNTRAGAFNDVGAFVDEVGRMSRGHPPPERVLLVVACPEPRATLASAAVLRDLYRYSERGRGITWSTGWPRATVSMTEADPATLPPRSFVVRYCAGRHLEVAAID